MKLHEFAVSGKRADSPVRSFFGLTPEEAKAKALERFPDPVHFETGEIQVEEVTGDENCLRWMGQSWFPHGAMTNAHVLGMSYEKAREAFEADRQAYIATLLASEK